MDRSPEANYPLSLYSPLWNINIWFADELFEQCDSHKQGLIDVEELVMFCIFANPVIKEERIRSSFDGFDNQLNHADFVAWATANKSLVNPDYVPASPIRSNLGNSGSMGGLGSAGSISRVCMELPCLTIDEHVLTPIK